MSLYLDRIAKGLCGIPGCKIKPEPGKKTCEYHRAKDAKKAAERRASNKVAGKCIGGCGATENLSPGGRCPKCLDVNATGRAVAASENKATIEITLDLDKAFRKLGVFAAKSKGGKSYDGPTTAKVLRAPIELSREMYPPETE